MSDVHNIKFGVCDTCLKFPCRCAKPTGALTREQVEEAFNAVYWHGDQQGVKQCKVLDGVDTLRATITQQAQELQCERDKIASMRNSFPVDAASWRGVDELDVCAECGGAGTKLYGNTSTYHYSVGGQAMTLSVCDKCWGSGNKQKPWRSWKLVEQQAQELKRTRGAMSAQDERERAAGEQCGVPYAENGCDWPWGVAEVVQSLRQQLAAMTTERDVLSNSREALVGTVKEVRQQLAASQARCREMEREIESLTTCGCEGCDDNLEESAFCLPCMNKVQQQVTQLQTTLTAREARIAELEDWQKIVLGSGTDQETVIRMAANEYTKTAVQCWKDHTKKIEAERNAAVQALKRLQLTWTTARPTVAGDWWARYGPYGMARPVELVNVDGVLCMLTNPNGTHVPVNNMSFDDHQWSDKPIPLPTEPQQARGSSGGAANHYGGQR